MEEGGLTESSSITRSAKKLRVFRDELVEVAGKWLSGSGTSSSSSSALSRADSAEIGKEVVDQDSDKNSVQPLLVS
jgi:hypothetical protein